MNSPFTYTVDTSNVEVAGVATPYDHSQSRSTPFQQMLSARASLLNSHGSYTGMTVNENTALRLAAVYSSIRIIAETIGSLPVQVFEVNQDGSTGRTRSHPVAELLSVEPNPDQTPLVYAETTMQHVLGWGNTYSAITYDNRTGVPTSLRHFHPSDVTVDRDPDSRLLIYEVSNNETGQRTFDQSEMLHIPGFGNGILGYSPVRYFAESIGLGMAQERFASLYFKSGAKPNLIVETDKKLGDEAFNSLQKMINQGFSGDRAFGALLLEGGMTATAVSIPMNEAQLLESRNFSGQDISQRMFRIPAHISGYTRDLKYDHMEQADLQFTKHCLTPWLVRREQELRRKLFRPGERARFEIKHNLDGLLRADLTTRYEAHKTAILSAFGTINERRQLENLPPVEGGNQIILAESVFGQQNGGETPDEANDNTPEPEDNSREADPRLKKLLEQQLRGLLNRERTFVERNRGRSDWEQRAKEFYAKHRELIEERFGDLGVRLGGVFECVDARAELFPGYTREDCERTLDEYQTTIPQHVESMLQTETESDET